MPDPIQADPGAGGTPPAPGGGQIEPGAGQPGAAAAETYTIDGQTLTADQVKEALKAKADYDRLMPEFTRKSQLLSDPDKILEHSRKTWPERFPAAPAPAATPEEQQRAEALKTLKDLGVLTREEAESLADKRVEEHLAKREADAFVKEERQKLEEEWNGQDGKPKFDFKEIAQHAIEGGFPTLTSAFRDLKDAELREWFAANKPTPKVPVIPGPGGGNPPVSGAKPMRLDDESYDRKFEEYFGKD